MKKHMDELQGSKINQLFQEASTAIAKEDYLTAEEKYHQLSKIVRHCYSLATNNEDRMEYLSLCKEYENKEMYAKRKKEEKMDPYVLRTIVSFNDYIGDKEKEYLYQDIVKPWNDGHFHDRKKNGLLIYGPYETGKTILVKALAKEVKATLLPIKTLTDFSNDDYPDAINAVDKIVMCAFKEDRAIIFFDDPVCYFPKGDKDSLSYETAKLFSDYFKMKVRQIRRKKKEILFIASTNCPDKLSHLMLNDDLFNDYLRIDLPDDKTRDELIKVYLPNIADEVKSYFVSATIGYTSWQITEFCLELMKKEGMISIENVKNLIASVIKEYDDGYFEHLAEFEKEYR